MALQRPYTIVAWLVAQAPVNHTSFIDELQSKSYKLQVIRMGTLFEYVDLLCLRRCAACTPSLESLEDDNDADTAGEGEYSNVGGNAFDLQR